MIISLLDFFVPFIASTVLPIWIFSTTKRDAFLLSYGLVRIFTLNTALMALIRDFGGMDFLERIGRHPWFALQYEISSWAYLASEVCLGVFLIRLLRQKWSTQKASQS